MQPACGSSDTHSGHICVADEHFVATVLAVYSFGDTLDGIGQLTFADWRGSGWHPRTYWPGADVLQTVALMRTMPVAKSGCVLLVLHTPRAVRSCCEVVERVDLDALSNARTLCG